MVSRISQVTLDANSIEELSAFWSQALNYEISIDGDGSAHLCPPEPAYSEAPTIWLQPVGEPKRAKNRNHLDLTAADGDFEAEVERLITLGARRTDVGQTGSEGFTVLADPEGNEFCVLHGDPHRRG